jgi:uncharacterized OsmC-like protein
MDLISIQQLSNQKFSFVVRGHEVIADMSHEEGGNNEGPSPSEMLVGAFGVCIGMAVARYFQTIGFAGEVAAYLTYQLADKPKRISNIVVDLEMPEDFPEKRLSAIQRVIEACPVHGTLTHPPQIDVEIG